MPMVVASVASLSRGSPWFDLSTRPFRTTCVAWLCRLEVQVWNWKILANGSDPQFGLASDDPLSKSIAIWTRPVAVLIDEWIDQWGRLDSLDNRQGFVVDPLLNQSRWPIAHPLVGSQKVLVKMPPAGRVLVCALPHFPSITVLMLTSFSIVKDQQPIVVSNETGKTRNLCSMKLNSDHDCPPEGVILLRQWSCRQGEHASKGTRRESHRRLMDSSSGELSA